MKECEAQVSVCTAIFSRKILKVIKLEGFEVGLFVSKSIQLTVVSFFAFIQVGHLDLISTGIPYPKH